MYLLVMVGGGGGRYLCLYLQLSDHLYVTPFDE